MCRDYVGWAWYDTQFYVFQGWQDSRVMLRSLLFEYFPEPLNNNPNFLQVWECSLHSHGVSQWSVCHRALWRSPPLRGRCHRCPQILRKVKHLRSYKKLANIFRNLLTVAVNNTLTRFTVPQGYTRWGEQAQGYPADYSTLEYNFDFFNYAGIHRCVIQTLRARKLIICTF